MSQPGAGSRAWRRSPTAWPVRSSAPWPSRWAITTMMRRRICSSRVICFAVTRGGSSKPRRARASWCAIGPPPPRSADPTTLGGPARAAPPAAGGGGGGLSPTPGRGRFKDAPAASGLGGVSGAGTVAVGDYDNDGFLDLFVTSLDGAGGGGGGGGPALYHNRGDGTFEPDARAGELRRKLRGVAGLDAAFFDFDNDGFLEIGRASCRERV